MMDFLLQRNANPEEIRSALAAFYHAKRRLDLESWVENENYHTIALTGDVALLLSVYDNSNDELALARYLAHTLRMKLIISDYSINPYTWILIDEEGKQHPIYQDTAEQPENTFVVDSRHKHLLQLE
ncbi:hypothetical protein MUN82_17370 [Hymenobacter aerilatus]|uniref:Uncharacterized protein n=1 Tax=Hymenobacter aerilatus TaxID=2932251 RepID=A0A8T9SY26_9BACT|nr:hypothetical protein [Hymenobacter aerilatus]UOR04706.1 hypothetical protein MUN82_17370 [Hymenobacter aerilatus]